MNRSPSPWTLHSPPHQIQVVDLQEEPSSSSDADASGQSRVSDFIEEAPPQTGAPTRPPNAAEADHGRTSETGKDTSSFTSQTDLRRLTAITEVKGPQLIGGLGAYYLQIHYPEPARRKGIQGRLMLRFDVTETGRAVDIDVSAPLHPLLDSTAVRALRAVRFRPATQHGVPVSMSMKLPVRFRILSDPTAPRTAGSFPPADSADRTD
ncbi:MAG: energy transducer TonB [Salinibacter sp.]